MSKLVVVMILALFSCTCFATLCQSTSGPNAQTASVTQNIAVLQSLPKGTKLWIGDEFTLGMACWQNGSAKSENVYLYLNPADKANNMLGDDIEVGVTVNGVDLICSVTGASECKTDMGITLGSCGNSRGCEATTRRQFNVTIRPFVSKKSDPVGNKEGSLTTVSSYQLLAFDGVGGVNTGDGYYKFFINNLNNFRYVSCASTLSISPQTVNFGNIAGRPDKGVLIKEIPFTVSSSKQCDSVYAIGAVLTPINAVVEDNLLIPSDNDAVGIRILTDNNRSIVPFNSEFRLIEATNQLLSSKRFIAQFLWNKNVYQPGSFSAGASVDIYYR